MTEAEVSGTWVLRYERDIPADDLVTCANAGADRAVDAQGVVWLRLVGPEDSIAGILGLVSAPSFRVRSGQLYRQREQVPVGVLDTLSWEPLDGLIERRLPVAKYPESLSAEGIVTPAVGLRLVAAAQTNHNAPRKADGILTPIDVLQRWADGAPAKRLASLRWALVGGDALVLGESLPMVDGAFFFALDRLFIPAGSWCTPDLSPKVVQRLFDEKLAERESLHFWMPDQTVVSIPTDELQSMTRAGVRSA